MEYKIINQKCLKCIYRNENNKCWAIKEDCDYGKNGCDFREIITIK